LAGKGEILVGYAMLRGFVGLSVGSERGGGGGGCRAHRDNSVSLAWHFRIFLVFSKKKIVVLVLPLILLYLLAILFFLTVPYVTHDLQATY